MICDGEADSVNIVSESSLNAFPAYQVEWITYEDDIERYWVAKTVCTDTYTYVYAFGTESDFFNEMLDTWLEVLDNLTLEFF